MSSFRHPVADFGDCPQPVAEPTSDDELQLIFDVESLQTQLSEAGRPVDEKIAQLFIQSVTPNKPLTERIRRWKARRDHLQKSLDRPHATAHPTIPPVLADPLPQKGPPDHLRLMPVVASNSNDSGTPPEAVMDDRDPQQRPGAGMHKRRQGNAQVERPPRKRPNQKPCYHYKERDDGKPPEMSLLHVNFARLCVGWLKERPEMTQNDLISRFNASEYSRPEQYARELKRGQNSSGKADHFFTNGYFRIQQLKAMARGTLPLPVRLQQVLEQPASASAGGNSRDRKRQRRSSG